MTAFFCSRPFLPVFQAYFVGQENSVDAHHWQEQWQTWQCRNGLRGHCQFQKKSISFQCDGNRQSCLLKCRLMTADLISQCLKVVFFCFLCELPVGHPLGKPHSHLHGFLYRRENKILALASVNTLDISWWILFKFYLLFVCDLTAEKMEFQVVLNFSLREKSTQMWIGLEQKILGAGLCHFRSMHSSNERVSPQFCWSHYEHIDLRKLKVEKERNSVLVLLKQITPRKWYLHLPCYFCLSMFWHPEGFLWWPPPQNRMTETSPVDVQSVIWNSRFW